MTVILLQGPASASITVVSACPRQSPRLERALTGDDTSTDVWPASSHEKPHFSARSTLFHLHRPPSTSLYYSSCRHSPAAIAYYQLSARRLPSTGPPRASDLLHKDLPLSRLRPSGLVPLHCQQDGLESDS
jgi:hypothetical protein